MAWEAELAGSIDGALRNYASIAQKRLIRIRLKQREKVQCVERTHTHPSEYASDATVWLGDEEVSQHCKVLDSDAFDIVTGTDFLRPNAQVKLLSLQCLHALHCDFSSGLFSVPLELSGRKESGLCYVNQSYRNENYQLVPTRFGKWTGRPAGTPK